MPPRARRAAAARPGAAAADDPSGGGADDTSGGVRDTSEGETTEDELSDGYDTEGGGGRPAAAAPDGAAARQGEPAAGASWGGVLASAMLYVACVGSAYVGPPDVIHGCLLLSAVACTFDLPLGQRLRQRAAAAVGKRIGTSGGGDEVGGSGSAGGDDWWSFPPSTLLSYLWLPAGVLSAAELLFAYSIDLGSVGAGARAAVGAVIGGVNGSAAEPTGPGGLEGGWSGGSPSTVPVGGGGMPRAGAADGAWLGIGAADLIWFAASAEPGASSRGAWDLCSAMRAPLALHALAIAQQVRG